VLIADVQALTDNFLEPEKVSGEVRNLVLDYVGAGIDPKKTTIVVQSMIPEIAELTVFYMNLVSLNRVLRNPTVKEEVETKRNEREFISWFCNVSSKSGCRHLPLLGQI